MDGGTATRRRTRIQDAIKRFYDWHDQLIGEGRLRGGSRPVIEGRQVSRERIVDGPYSEAKEGVGGYWWLLARSLDEAAAAAAENPCRAFGLAFEIRPLGPERASAFRLASETPAR